MMIRRRKWKRNRGMGRNGIRKRKDLEDEETKSSLPGEISHQLVSPPFHLHPNEVSCLTRYDLTMLLDPV